MGFHPRHRALDHLERPTLSIAWGWPGARHILLAALLVLSPWTFGAASPPASGAEDLEDLRVRFKVEAQGFEEPVFVTGTGDGSGDRFVVEKAGRIRRLRMDGSTEADPVLDISDRVLHHAERGLLGLAIHPRFAENGRLFVLYSRRDDGATVISRFTLRRSAPSGSGSGRPVSRPPEATEAPPPPETNEAPPPPEATEVTLLELPQIWTTHKGGMLAFDLDGMLLVGIGDGGSGNDPLRHGLDPRSLLGKLLRLDVDAATPYASPSDNGFADDPDARPEIHAVGLRNPWRFSVDRHSGDVYIGDVGQSAWEEVDVLPRGRRQASFGWSDMEGPACLGDRPCDASAHLAPAVAYRHDDTTAHCAIIGGYAYRGTSGTLPPGTYLFGDHCSGVIWAVAADELVAGTAAPQEVGRLDHAFGQLVSFGEDDAGELYAVTDSGVVLRMSSCPTWDADRPTAAPDRAPAPPPMAVRPIPAATRPWLALPESSPRGQATARRSIGLLGGTTPK